MSSGRKLITTIQIERRLGDLKNEITNPTASMTGQKAFQNKVLENLGAGEESLQQLSYLGDGIFAL
ncbi:hypothetical protein K443DRAFT_16201 [Laccaria amethystina LaAM-08-1]|uniref:Uncharacterized protein n=1 Tax=Laccaria amethystina LaAM-08-1 TaxID=1095629 RepID=A0A0C9WPD4_9AGAR|nr:hypothetical protein K443DRAFT_16201 [Laccaria amethystina LaAM-08-1]